MNKENLAKLTQLSKDLMRDMQQNSRRKVADYKATGRVEYDEFYPRSSKGIIDNIDQVLGEHYGLSHEELDHIINFDFKHRVGSDS